mmetsp:Transcript_16755/g.47690  ORF Transcript_16755/g.47690 Transcript_16755/m.47690 type:complete len:412 (+) Transcript_16755:69-1304(+)
MSEAEAKHRKQVLGRARDQGAAAGPRRGGGHSTMRRALHFLLRRRVDITLVSLYIAIVVAGHLTAMFELLPPPGETRDTIIRLIYFSVFALFNLSYCGVVCYGPGRPPAPPEPGQEPQLPPAMVALLSTGRLCTRRPFGAEAHVCSKCETWKPAIVHHCNICAACSVWMDHHCHLCAQCIGFQNLRCFLLWVFYGYLLVGDLIVLTVWRSMRKGLPDDGRSWTRSVAWLAYLWCLACLLNNQTVVTFFRILGGWPSEVLYRRFKNLFKDGDALYKSLSDKAAALSMHDPGFDTLTSAARELQAALQQVSMHGSRIPGNLWGPFLAKPTDTFAAIFGEPLSWRWLLPLVRGGLGDPFRPTIPVEDACQDWVAVGTAMETCSRVLAVHEFEEKQKALRVRALVDFAAGSTAEP